jgi:hypothetical protein
MCTEIMATARGMAYPLSTQKTEITSFTWPSVLSVSKPFSYRSPATQVQFFTDAGNMIFYRFGADMQFQPDLTVAFSLSDFFQDPAFTDA